MPGTGVATGSREIVLPDGSLETPGDVLRRWRKSRNLTQGAVGRAVPPPEGPVGASAISQWETGARRLGPTLSQVKAIDHRFGAEGAFTALYAATRTREALEPDTDWWHNFQGPSGPCWAWVRTLSSRPVSGVADAGPFRLDFEVPPGDGIFLQVYGFASNPAVHIELISPGWVDFGLGTIPGDLGVPIKDAVNFAVMGPRADRDPAVAAAPHAVLRQRFGSAPGWFDRFKARAGHRVEVARTLLTRTLKTAVSATTDLTAAPILGEDAVAQWTGAQYRTLREARGLYRQDAADLATAYCWTCDPPLTEVTAEHIRRLEEGARPRVAQLVERLDMIYKADGRTCLAQVAATEASGPFQVQFPPYWIGPIWVAFHRTDSSTSPTRAKLEWSPWRKPLNLAHDVVVTCRRATADSSDLTVHVPAGWRMTAGVGVHRNAIDINEGWGFLDQRQAREALTKYYEILMQALRGH